MMVAVSKNGNIDAFSGSDHPFRVGLKQQVIRALGPRVRPLTFAEPQRDGEQPFRADDQEEYGGEEETRPFAAAESHFVSPGSVVRAFGGALAWMLTGHKQKRLPLGHNTGT
jgi:hypothetical protein